MITRAQMPRQLRDKGGIASVTPREKYGLGSKLKDRFRKLIPNELASIAVTAAPFVAPFNPGIAAIMRGVGRFDQRGSISDALKQGLGTFAFGKGVRALGGAPAQEGFFGTPGDRFTSPLSQDRTVAVKDFFKSDATKFETKAGGKEAKKGIEIVSKTAEKAFEGVPILRDLPDTVKQKLLVGGLTAGATGVYEYYVNKFRPPEPGETMEEYLAARKERVGTQMRSLFDNYFKSDPEYSALDDAGRDAFVARYNIRKGGMPVGIMRTNKAGVMERDYRDEGGFVPVGIKEKADDVPAMLSKNEFVFTADAVRGAGNGSIEKGAQKMYDTMKKLEKRVV